MSQILKISIALCTYNGEKYIFEQIKSIANQTVSPYELVVCDDGSSDKTLTIISELANTLNFPTRIVKNEKNYHFTGNFLKAASLCGGDAIAFCDQDDVWDSKKIARCIEVLQKTQADLLIHEGRVIDANGVRVNLKIPNLKENLKWRQKTPYDRAAKGFAMVITKASFQEVMTYWSWEEYFELKAQYGVPLGHDLIIYASCIQRKKIEFIQEELVCYRIHDSNITASATATKNLVGKVFGFFSAIHADPEKYLKAGEKWIAEAKFLDSYRQRAGSNSPQGLKQLGDWFAKRGQLWITRSSIYDNKLSRVNKLFKIWSLLNSGGYYGRTAPSIGLKALIKDIFLLIFLKANNDDSKIGASK